MTNRILACRALLQVAILNFPTDVVIDSRVLANSYADLFHSFFPVEDKLNPTSVQSVLDEAIGVILSKLKIESFTRRVGKIVLQADNALHCLQQSEELTSLLEGDKYGAEYLAEALAGQNGLDTET